VNGPARFRRGDFQYKHWLDGDGMICALRFGPGASHLHQPLHPNQEACSTRRGRQVLYRGFVHSIRGRPTARRVTGWEPPVNVSVYPFEARYCIRRADAALRAGSCYASKTRGEYDFHGKLNHLSPFAAHAKLDPSTGHMLNFGISYAGRPSGGERVRIRRARPSNSRPPASACDTRIPIMISA